MKVQKGHVLAVLEHPDYIQLQQDFIDSQSQLLFLGQEKERQQVLARENVNAAKSLQQAEAQYLSMKARTDGLAARLQLLGLDPASVSKGPLTPSIRIISPITGYVTGVHVNLGKYAASDQVMFELVDTRHLHAELQVFESDLARLRVGQRVWVKLLNEESEREASVYLIGKEISPSRTVQVHCHFRDADEHLVPGMYFSARIETAREQRWALPAEAVVQVDGKLCVFLRAADGSFALKEIVASESVAGLTPVEGLRPEDDVVVKGSFFLLSALRSGDEEL
jgi:cobalt-zinc-cadmium efflux system membrane fusion protein